MRILTKFSKISVRFSKISLSALLLLGILRIGAPETGIDAEAPMSPIIELPGVSEDHYIEFPTLAFDSCAKESAMGKLRMTFEGTWHNLAPQINTHIMTTI